MKGKKPAKGELLHTHLKSEFTHGKLGVRYTLKSMIVLPKDAALNQSAKPARPRFDHRSVVIPLFHYEHREVGNNFARPTTKLSLTSRLLDSIN